jgi:hypothetical protein
LYFAPLAGGQGWFRARLAPAKEAKRMSLKVEGQAFPSSIS